MKKTLSLLILFTTLTGLLLIQPSQSSHAQGPIVASPTPYPGEFDFITFEMLGKSDKVMVGPYSSTFIRFGTPDSWYLESGAKIILDLETIVNSSRSLAEDATEYSGAMLEISMDGNVVDVIFLETGSQTIEIDVPKETLHSTRSDGRHSLQLYLDAAIDCLFDHETAVLIRSSSGISLPHHSISHQLDITRLPRPIYQRSSLLPEDALILLPDSPTETELQSAMIVAATFGRMTEGEQKISLTSISALTEEQKTNAHIIMIGKASSLPILNMVIFPTSTTGENATQEVASEEGVVQMALSPWNASRVVLYIGGAEDNAVIKAAQAFSSGALRAGKHSSLSVISNVADAIEIKDVPDDRTLASLGYETKTLSGVGYNSLDYEFLIPLGKTPSGEISFKLLYAHSAIFDFEASGAIISLNGENLGSIKFSDETANQVTELNINIPAYALKPGRNTLSIRAELLPLDYCSVLNNDGLWMSISEDSLLHIPLIDAGNTPTLSGDLSMFPAPFINSPSLSELSFIFPKDNILSWELGANLAENLGQYAVGKTLHLSAYYADNLPDETRENKDLIIIGQASQLPILDELAESMPAYFEKGSNIAIETNANITFSIPENTDLGYLELFPAPWDSSRSILTILGSTPLGLQWSQETLLNPDVKPDMHGDYVVVHAEKMYAVDTEAGLGAQNLSATAVPGEYPTLIPDTVPTTSYAYQQDWVITAIKIVSGMIILLLLGLIIKTTRKDRKNKK
ncbi:MAG: hypothetical protein DRI32_00190 [Chloroflexi bacterium]|nr:MAG: hypothetical protein DRI32_00190 [Chloroflexota bacterium]